MNYLTIIHILLGIIGCILSYIFSMDISELYHKLLQDAENLRILNIILILCTSYVSLSVAAKATRYKSKTSSWVLNLLASFCIASAMAISVLFELFDIVIFDNSVFSAFVLLSIGVWIKILVSIYAFFKFKNNKNKDKDKFREHGVIKWFNEDKGFGFITRNKGNDLFVHHRAFVNLQADAPKEGQQVHFLINKGFKGLQAYSVRII